MVSLLIIDDDRRLLDLLEKFLKESGFSNLITATNTAQARSFLALQTIDILILDIMMAGEDGIQFTKNLRQNGHYDIGILLLTARDSVEDRIMGLDCGADDYLTKPFEPRELLARINALIRRKNIPPLENNIIKLGDFWFDKDQNKLFYKKENVFLSTSEMILLKTLAQAPNKPFTREELAQRLGHTVCERSVDVQIVRLRRKIGDDPKQPKFLQTVRHIGYGLYPNQN